MQRSLQQKMAGRSLKLVCAQKMLKKLIAECSMRQGVEEFLSLTKYAECVVTNSLHGTIFAVQYSKPLCVFSREQCDTKIKELLAFNGGVRYGGILDRQR
ncbi:MAG: polysaccharide pyruvyl transferase family protein [Pilosibacter sp.]